MECWPRLEWIGACTCEHTDGSEGTWDNSVAEVAERNTGEGAGQRGATSPTEKLMVQQHIDDYDAGADADADANGLLQVGVIPPTLICYYYL